MGARLSDRAQPNGPAAWVSEPVGPDFSLDWVPLRPQLVCEVSYDKADGWRFRHAGHFVRWRPDRDPASCTVEQFATPAAP